MELSWLFSAMKLHLKLGGARVTICHGLGAKFGPRSKFCKEKAAKLQKYLVRRGYLVSEECLLVNVLLTEQSVRNDLTNDKTFIFPF